MKKKEMTILILCLLVGLALRIYTFDQRSLWMDEVHTFNDSRDDLKGQLKFYQENPAYLHPPLFFLLTHLFHPFTKPERDLRILPVIFGWLSIPMFYLLARSFSPEVALPCTLSLTFMAYHISLSQDGRSYSMLMLIGMAGLYFLMKHLKTSSRSYLLWVALSFATLFHMSYSSIPFIALSQMLWLYRGTQAGKGPRLSSFLILNGILLVFCLPWLLFLGYNYAGQPVKNPFHMEEPGSIWTILYGVFHDWVPYPPLMIISVLLLVSYPLISKDRRNATLLLAVFFIPIAGLYLFCKLFDFTHFISSRYFINFLPPFFISIYLSLLRLELRFEKLKKFLRLRFLFVILFIASNLVILPLYYQAEKQDLRGLVASLKDRLREGDKIFVETASYIPGILHYLGAHPQGRHHDAPSWKDSEGKIALKKSFTYRNRTFAIFHSKRCCTQYVADGSRIWIIVGKVTATKLKTDSPSILMGYFDGSFLNFNRFPDDASIYLFLWDPLSPGEKGIDLPIE